MLVACSYNAIAKEDIYESIYKVDFSDADENIFLNYPFIKPDLIDESQFDDDENFSKTEIKIAQIKLAKLTGEYLFVQKRGSLYCGSSGCSIYIYYSDRHNNHKLLEIISTYDTYIQDCGQIVNVITYGKKGYSVQPLQPLSNAKNISKLSYSSLYEIPSCSTSEK